MNDFKRLKPTHSRPDQPIGPIVRGDYLRRRIDDNHKPEDAGQKSSRGRFKHDFHIRLPKNLAYRTYILGMVLFLAFSIVAATLNPFLDEQPYKISASGRALLSESNTKFADKLVHDPKTRTYEFNGDFSPLSSGESKETFGGARITATIATDAKEGVSITDPYNEVSFTMKPLFRAGKGKKDGSQIFYRIENGKGFLVYTPQANGVKEDIVLNKFIRDRMTYEYELDLGDSLEARLEKSGSLGIYGTDLPLNGDVSTGTEKDAELLQKARTHAPKNKLLFEIPAPYVKETGREQSVTKSHYELQGNRLKVVVDNLKAAQYPLTIDPSVAVTTVTDFFRDMNPDMNVDFDPTNNLVKRGILTGGNIASWTTNPTNNLNTARFLHGTATYNGYVYAVGGAGANTTTNITGANMVEMAQISSGTPATIGAWTATTNTGLPAGGLSRLQLVAHNGYLYAIGGSPTDTTGATRSSAIYYSRIQSNGQPSVWQTGTSSLPTAKYSFGAAASNGYLYVVGGKTASTATGTTEVVVCTLTPSGDTAGCAGDDSILPAARYGHDVQIYNGYVYVVGGNLNGTLTNTVLYAAADTVGGIYGATGVWKSANSFTTARENLGTNFTTTINGYIYLSGGCSVVNGTSQACTTVANDTQLSQINADGSLGPWFANAGGSSLSRVGSSLAIWRDTLYNIAGCTAMNAAISCQTGAPTLNTQQYTVVDAAGELSASLDGTALPQATAAHGVAVVNGYIYRVGGCNSNTCEGNRILLYQTSWALLSNSGGIVTNGVASCNGGGAATWCTENSTFADALNKEDEGNNSNCGGGFDTDRCGSAGFSMVTYNGSMYVIGGFNGNAAMNNIWKATPNSSNGDAGAWTQQSGTLSSTNTYSASVAQGGFIYVIGGCTAAAGSIGCSTYQTTVQRCTLNSSGNITANCVTTNQLQLPANGRALSASAFYSGFIYLAGGADSSAAQLDTILYAKIDSSGNVVDPDGETVINNTWKTTTGSLVATGGANNHKVRRGEGIAVNGYLYLFGGHTADANDDGNANDPVTYTDVEAGKINTTTGDITSFYATSTSLTTGLWDPRAVFSNGYLYLTGGVSSGTNPPNGYTNRSTTNQYFQIYNADNFGTGSWSSQTTYSSDRLGAGSAVYNGYLYVAGGCDAYTVSTSSCTNVLVAVRWAKINPDGAIGVWDTGAGGGVNLPLNRGFGSLEALNGHLYFMGGVNGSGVSQDEVYFTPLGSNGSPTGWAAVNGGLATGKLPAARGHISSAVYNNRIYITGGVQSGTNQVTTYYSPALPNGGDITAAWTATTGSFTTARREHSTVAIGGYLYVIGGFDGTSYLNDSQVGAINATTGDIATWGKTQDIPQTQSFMGAVAANGYIYLFGGRNGTTTSSCFNSVYFTSVGSNGNLDAWQRGLNNFTTARMGAAAAFYNGHLYVMGGNDCTSIISDSSRVQASGQQSQAMKATFSRYLDFGGDATPGKVLANGTHFAISSVDIDRWRLRYRSSRAATNSWGSLTSINPVPFGMLTSGLVAIDGSDAAQGVSQYWQLIFDIDMASTFTFTDNSQPTLTDYELYYSPAASKRLRNGRDFRDQSKQNLDARP